MPSGKSCLVVHPQIAAETSDTGRTSEARLEEAVGLARAIALDVVHSEIVPVRRPRPATLLGQGAVDRLRALMMAEGGDGAPLPIDVAIINAPLTPVQQRNLEKAWNTKVVDRTGLILEIFGERARTAEGEMQVELAALEYQKSRLVRSWTHLERQRGGFGFVGGPGESQLETDRRLIREAIARLRRELEQVRRTRALHRRARARVPYPVVALVGYTNAGKSTLFNRLTGAQVFAQDQLFATLDPTMRAIALPSGRKAILSDTVGFISELPHELIEAFRATLEEVCAADLVLHVRDISHPESEAQCEDVETVIRSLGIAELLDNGGMIEVLNKIDLLSADERSTVINRSRRQSLPPALVSARSGEGCEELLRRIDERLAEAMDVIDVRVPAEDGATLAWLYRHGEVVSREDVPEGGVHLRVRLDAAHVHQVAHLQAADTPERACTGEH